MISKILRILVTILLVLLPFLGGALIGKYTPYADGNSMMNYILIYAAFILVIGSLLFYIIHRFRPSFVQPTRPGVILFFIGCVMLGIAGLSAPPDLSIKMLEHPEREHYRYIILFIGAILFGLYFLDLFINNRLQLKRTQKRIAITLFIIAMIELIWEFSHHYSYPEGLKEWVGKGNEAKDFEKNYDDWKAITKGAIGRLVIFMLIIWLSVKLYKIRSVSIWNPILNSFFCTLGIASAVSMFLFFNYHMEFPKALGFLFVFFIPGIPFLLMYWIGVALLTKRPEQTT
jgi:hypothetical protein